jgi:hypothetical protein
MVNDRAADHDMAPESFRGVERLGLDRLTVGQHGLRHSVGSLHRMMDFVAAGGVWSLETLREHTRRHGLPEPSLIRLSAFHAGPRAAPLRLIHDGHHRLVATHLAGRGFLHPQEYAVTPWGYEDYLAVNFGRGWVTPFDPRTHARTADFAAWKRRVLEAARADPALAERMIREEPSAYRVPRRYADIASLADDCCSLELDRWRAGRSE